MTKIGRILKSGLHLLLALVLLFEEWGWHPLSRLVARLARWSAWAALEQRISRLPPWAALLSFGVPALLLVPAKLAAVYLFSLGHYALGVLLLLVVKLLGTALLARLFDLTRPGLMQLPWFARWYPRWKAWKDQLLHQVRRSPSWTAVQGLRRRARARWAAWRGSP